MSRDPVLARKTFAIGRFEGERVPMTMTVCGGLHMLRGNSAPHFSLTYWAHRAGFPNQRESGGASHELIARKFGHQFDDLAALHLCDIDGKPMHAVSNGWYWLAGALGGAGETYHGGATHAPEECLANFAKLWRTSPRETARICGKARGMMGAEGQALLTVEAANLADFWKFEADQCVANHSLVVFGDPWPAVA